MTQPRPLPKGQTPARLNARGIDFSDYQKIDYRVNRKGEDCVEVCRSLAHHLDEVALEKQAAGHQLSACQLSYKAAALYRISHYGILEFDDEKSALYQKELEVFSRALSLDTRFSAERTEIPYREGKLVGWLMKPLNCSDDVPVVLATGGITGFKEEVHYVITHFLERGIAVLNIDGPGQGETFYHYGIGVEPESELAHKVMIDYLIDRTDVGNNIALYGLCMGGLLVARTAAAQRDKVKAIVCMGGGYELTSSVREHPQFEAVFAYRGNVAVDEIYPFVDRFGMDTLSTKIDRPLLIIHNRPDFLIPSSNVKRIYEEATTSDKQQVYFKGAEHNAHNANAEACALAADWLVERLFNRQENASTSTPAKQADLVAG
ncbi:2,6-dihydropseudooxynicotine hydrolase [Vibrio ruber DSM 16370]|uniref:2,6-dihydropseudooxynicotine hydrolase n=1 Tax=Vibrio ruber (strain DSM 16370 / JCM 11486 / BCRC 17186 / CECT 7878 / LMG 23124 / VR1) TaxID=1123498 RepID=A0A1R4LTP3_VIBR1|nr:alpha/beta fold hydrolase [Vibrio ruber]SJN59833.1 2,6-dihydropseudooxynicotine hydrolase [Vibrio ruber DSM 16370]